MRLYLTHFVIAAAGVVSFVSACTEDPAPPARQSEPPGERHDMDMTAGRSVQGDFAHRELVVLSPPREVSPEFRTALTSLLHGYEQLAAALFDEALATAQQRAESLRREVEEVEAEGLSDVGAEAWEQHRRVLRTSLHQLSEAETIDEARSHFSHASEALYCALKSFGGAEHRVFVVYCRMAFGGRGAYWLTSDPGIRNPYMGEAMPDCGQRRETIPVRAATVPDSTARVLRSRDRPSVGR